MDLVRQFIDESHDDLPAMMEARAMLDAAWDRQDEADALLTALSRHWDLRRMALVDRNILRLAAWELLDGRTPRRVVINEAIRLAKEFSTAESPRFVNGILDAVVRLLDESDDPSGGEHPPADDESSPESSP